MSNSPKNQSALKPKHFSILDALRIVLAFWVAVGHVGMLPLFAGADTAGWAHLVARGWNTVVFKDTCSNRVFRDLWFLYPLAVHRE
jgi:hypothetical protein